MSAIINIGISKDKLEFNDKGWANLTLYIEDETNQYGQNVSATISQTKEQREAKEARVYVGNGKVVFVNGNVVKADAPQEQLSASQQSMAGREVADDLPF